MTLNNFVNTINDWHELKAFCDSNEFLKENYRIINHVEMEEHLTDDIDNAVRHNFLSWKELRDRLIDIDDDCDYYLWDDTFCYINGTPQNLECIKTYVIADCITRQIFTQE